MEFKAFYCNFTWFKRHLNAGFWPELILIYSSPERGSWMCFPDFLKIQRGGEPLSRWSRFLRTGREPEAEEFRWWTQTPFWVDRAEGGNLKTEAGWVFIQPLYLFSPISRIVNMTSGWTHFFFQWRQRGLVPSFPLFVKHVLCNSVWLDAAAA